MARPPVFTRPTKLWSRAEGWREWPIGESDPGGSWFAEEDGDEKALKPDQDVVKSLAEAVKREEALDRRVETLTASLAVAAGRAEKAEAQIAELTQRAEDAERAKKAAEDIAAGLSVERDRAVTAFADLHRRFAAFDPDGDGKPGGKRKPAEAADAAPATETPPEPETAAGDDPAAPDADADAFAPVLIPDDYAKTPWFALKALASNFTTDPIENKAAALAAIQAELERRAG
ncbi:hypothetical protein [Phenylobacterium sp.]|uniref:hypothetical protein n=1 Tax=Phenylobacterium sp. TaxID=1871053 RepID=UPI002639DB88|nr:hypothetical protein [Phenylobacterium sp.]